MPLAGDRVVHVWCRETETLGADAIRAAEAVLPADEHARRDRFMFPDDRREYTIAHDLLRRSLSRYERVPPAEWRFDTGEHGKPSISHPASGLSFNLSHTRGLVACAIAPGGFAVGVDVERVDRALESSHLAERFFSPLEIAALRRCPPEAQPSRFIELWTLKEAFIKALGLGLAHPLDAMSFDIDGGDSLVFVPPPERRAGEWYFMQFAPTPLTRLAVAVHGGADVAPRVIACREDAGHGVELPPVRASGWGGGEARRGAPAGPDCE